MNGFAKSFNFFPPPIDDNCKVQRGVTEWRVYRAAMAFLTLNNRRFTFGVLQNSVLTGIIFYFENDRKNSDGAENFENKKWEQLLVFLRSVKFFPKKG